MTKKAPDLTPAIILHYDRCLFPESYFIARARRRGIDEQEAKRMFDRALQSDKIVYACHVGTEPGVPAYALNLQQ